MIGMLSKQTNAYSDLDALMKIEKSTNQSFDDLSDFFKQAGLKIKYSSCVARADSRYYNSSSEQSEPYLRLYVKDRTSYKEMGINEHGSNWNSSCPKTQLIIETWSQICRKNNIPQDYYSPDMFVFIYNLPELLLNSHVRNSKQQIEDYFKGCTTKPAHIFVSSEPAIRIFYDSKQQLKREEKLGNIRQHKDRIVKILSSGIGIECFEEKSVLIQFRDCKTDSKNMYGFSRED
jgi:hypothetical protein